MVNEFMVKTCCAAFCGMPDFLYALGRTLLTHASIAEKAFD
jgi:hypothetical protein